jgi:hypothetical protein
MASVLILMREARLRFPSGEFSPSRPTTQCGRRHNVIDVIGTSIDVIKEYESKVVLEKSLVENEAFKGAAQRMSGCKRILREKVTGANRDARVKPSVWLTGLVNLAKLRTFAQA